MSSTPGKSDARSGSDTSPTLLQRILRHDEDAWKRLAFLYTPLIAYWCRRWHVSQADIDDVVQEVLQAVATHLSQFQPQKESGSFRAWLRGITRNKLLDYYRKLNAQPAAQGGSDAFERLQQVPAEPESRFGGLDEPEPMIHDLYLRAAEAIRGDFQEQTWQIFWQIVVEGKTPADVAAELKMRPAAVRMAKARVLRRLREEIGELAE